MTASARRPRGESRRKEILEAALQEFSSRGLQVVSIEDVAKRVGCNKSLVYYYFGSKDKLREAVMDEMINTTQALWADLRSHSFKDWAHTTTQWSQLHPQDPWVRLTVREGLADEGHAIREVERTRSLGRATRTVVEAQGRGEVDSSLDPEFVALLFLFLALGPAVAPHFARMITGNTPGEPAFHERYADFVDGLIRRLGPMPSTSAQPADDTENGGVVAHDRRAD